MPKTPIFTAWFELTGINVTLGSVPGHFKLIVVVVVVVGGSAKRRSQCSGLPRAAVFNLISN
jgi:hypothetical protein